MRLSPAVHSTFKIHHSKLGGAAAPPPASMHDTSTIQENYGRFEADDRRWDIAFWQRQGSAAIFDAVWGMILDHRLLTQRDATEPRLQRTVEHFGKA